VPPQRRASKEQARPRSCAPLWTAQAALMAVTLGYNNPHHRGCRDPRGQLARPHGVTARVAGGGA
jgi:hypothetical protein